MPRRDKAQYHFQSQMRKANQIMPAFLYKCSTSKRGDVVPPDGVLVYDTDLDMLFVGDGTTTGGLPVGAAKEEVRTLDTAAASTATVEGIFGASTAQTASGNTFTDTAHGLKVGDTITIMSSDGTLADVGLVVDTTYTVAAVADANTFTLTGVTFSGNGTQAVYWKAVTKTITCSAQTNTGEVFTAASHGLVVGSKVVCTGVPGSITNLVSDSRTQYTVATVPDANTFTLTGITISADGTNATTFAYDGTVHDDYITWAKGADLRTGDGITVGGTAPQYLANQTLLAGEYYMIKEDSDVNGGEERNQTTRFKVASSRAYALAGTNLTMRSLGSSVTFVATDVYIQGYEDLTVATPGVAHDIYLPDATSSDFGRFTIKKTSAAYAVTVKAIAGTIDGTAAATGVSLPSGQYASLTAVSDGTNWHLSDKETYVGATSWTLGATDTMVVDADTTDHTSGYVFNMDVGVAEGITSGLDAFRINLDVQAALDAAEIVKGVYVDANGIAANADTSGIIAYDALLTAVSTDRADLTGVKVKFDGTMDTADTVTGVLVDGASFTMNDTAGVVHGVEIAFASLTDTDYSTAEFNALDITMPASYQGTDVASAIKATGAGAEVDILSGAATIYGVDITCAADTQAINIDCSTDHTGANIITTDLDIAASNCNFINADIDVGTALTTGQVVNGVKIDIDGNAGDHAASIMNGIYLTSANTTSGINTGIYITGTWDKAMVVASTSGRLDIDSEIDNRGVFTIFDDFMGEAVAATEADSMWILNSGNDAQAVDPAISVQENGVIRLTTGDADGTVANDGSQIICHIPVQADSGNLVFETRLHINTAITDISVIAGLTDVTTLEEPFTIAGGDAITEVADDAVCFVYDTGSDADNWFACAVDSTDDDSGSGTTSIAPVADTYQVLRIEVSADGATIKFFIDGVLVKTLSGDTGVSPDVNLYATVIACATTTTSKTVDVDYIYCSHTRS